MLKAYMEWIETQNLSKTTINTYVPLVKLFLKEVGEDNINQKNIDEYFKKKREKHPNSTLNTIRYALKNFLQFLGKEDIEIPKHKKVDIKLPEFVSCKFFEEEIIPVVEYEYENSLKVKCIFYLMFYGGLRKGELVNLKRKDFDLDKRRVKLKGKRGKERITIYNKKTAELIKLYFSSEIEEQNAFNITPSGVYNYFFRIKHYFKEVNLTPHLLRHSFATYCLNEKELDISEVSRLLGHKSLVTTMIYLGWDLDKIQNKYDKK